MKVHLHPDIQSFRGRFIDAVYQISQNGIQVKRNFVVPANPQTQFQQQVRSAFGTVAGDWANVSGLQRQDWETLAQSYGRFNPNGTAYTLTGFQAFLMVNTFRALDGQALTQAAPQFPSIGSVAFITVENDQVNQEVSFNFQDLDVGTFLYKIRVNPVTPEPYALTIENARFVTIDPADAIISGTPVAQAVSLTIPYAELRSDLIDWANLAGGERIAVNIQKLSTDYAPQTTQGQYTEEFVSNI